MACVYSGTSLAAAVASFGTVRCHRLYAIHERRRPPLGRHSATSLAIEKNKIDNERHGKRKRCVPRKSAKHAVRTRIVMAPVHLENRVVPQIQASSTICNSCTFYPGAAGLVLRLNVVNPQHWVMMTALRCHPYCCNNPHSPKQTATTTCAPFGDVLALVWTSLGSVAGNRPCEIQERP